MRNIIFTGGIFTTSCASDVTHWPLDTQTCDVIISSWGYTANEVELKFHDENFITTFYQGKEKAL